jgi:hypothetical protein
MRHRLLARLGLGSVAATGLALLVLALAGLVRLDGPLKAAAAQQRLTPQQAPVQDVGVGCPHHRHRFEYVQPPPGQEL